MCRLRCSPPLRTAHSHHTAPYADHAPRCESGRSQRSMGSLAGFPWLGECSPNSITLLLHTQETAGRVSGSLHTRPIQSMAKPSKVWVFDPGQMPMVTGRQTSTVTESCPRPRQLSESGAHQPRWPTQLYEVSLQQPLAHTHHTVPRYILYLHTAVCKSR